MATTQGARESALVLPDPRVQTKRALAAGSVSTLRANRRPVRALRPLAAPYAAPAWSLSAGPDLSPEAQDYEIDYIERRGYLLLRYVRSIPPYNAAISVCDPAGTWRDYLAILAHVADPLQHESNFWRTAIGREDTKKR